MCDPAFLHLVCTECEVVHLTWPKLATHPEQDEARPVVLLLGSQVGAWNTEICHFS